ncbi:sialidase family protein [Paraglaciecola sp. L3A3]|uniref:WD40/YVTN/BNR-like repeat-containing protein n=1 Tax=Paraglaciecola sp. L3A3 TaxID=2686358 RepID=UPI00131DF09B|nr:sialidase family protein [Paraglaciecola sp. L3A3]
MKTSNFPTRFALTLCFLAIVNFGCTSPTEYSSNKQTDDFFEQIKNTKAPSDPNIEWQSIGPGMSGYNEKLWTHPTDPKAIFLGPDMHVAYGSWDSGHTWHNIQDPDGLGQEMKRILDIDFSHQDADFGMAIDWNGWLYQTKDRGRSWQKLHELAGSYKDVGVDPYDPIAFRKGWYDEQIGRRLAEISVDPSNDNLWYIGAGDFWNTKENHRSITRTQGNKLAYADYGYLLKSTNKGKTWSKISKGLPEDLDTGRILVHPENSQQIIAATNRGLMHSSNGGLDWQFAANGLPHNIPRDLTYHYDKATGQYTLYLIEQTTYNKDGQSVSSSGGIYTSTDGGKHWKNITGNLALDLTQISYPEEIQRYYRTLANWFEISPNAAKEQFPKLPTAVLPVFNRIVVNPNNSQEIYITYNKKHDRTFGPGEVWRTLDGGKTWLVVARHGKYWLSGKDKDYWAKRNNPTHTNIDFAHVQPEMDHAAENQGNRLLAINSAGQVFMSISQQTHRSSDKGKTWQQIDDDEVSPGSDVWVGRGDSNLPGRFMLLETGIPERRLLASGEHGVWQTVAADLPNKQDVALQQIEGQTNITGMVSISTIAVHPKDPNIIYLLAWRQKHLGKLRRSTDGGKSWENIATVVENDIKKVDGYAAKSQDQTINQVVQGPKGLMPAQNSLIIDPNNPDNMYFVMTRDAFSEIYRAPRRNPTKGDYGVMKSTDGGYNWQSSNQGIHAGASLRTITFDPADSNTLYAAATDDQGGLYKSSNQGKNWHRVTIPTVIKSVNNVFVDRNTQAIYISAGGFYTGKYAEGGAWRSLDNGNTWQQIFKAPLVLQVESSPVNPDLLVLTVGNQMRMDRQFMNPGIYLSQDGGNSWNKINKQLGNYDKIIDAKPDPYNPNVIWAAGWGSGWHIAYLNGSKESWLTK